MPTKTNTQQRMLLICKLDRKLSTLPKLNLDWNRPMQSKPNPLCSTLIKGTWQVISIRANQKEHTVIGHEWDVQNEDEDLTELLPFKFKFLTHPCWSVNVTLCYLRGNFCHYVSANSGPHVLPYSTSVDHFLWCKSTIQMHFFKNRVHCKMVN